MRTLNRAIHVLDEFVADGQEGFASREFAGRLGVSAQSASNTLTRLVRHGFVDRVRHGLYVIRPLGTLGTRAATDRLDAVLAIALDGIPHRLAWRSALGHHDLLARPTRPLQVAAARRVSAGELGGRPFQVVLERASTVLVGSEVWGASRVSGIERALLDAAHRPHLVGGAETLAEAVHAASARIDPERLLALARRLGREPALRRLASVGGVLGIGALADLATSPRGARIIPLDPRDEGERAHGEGIGWLDRSHGVRWPRPVKEIIAGTST